MICRLFIFRHAETTDNSRGIFSGWRDPKLTPKGLSQACQIADQLRAERIDYGFTSHLERARRTLEVVLEPHSRIPVFTDDRIIERCYGLLQGKSKRKIANERPQWFAEVHRGYDFPPPEGESLKMVEKRTLPFIWQFKRWLKQNPGNVAISCHGNSMRPIRRVFEHLSRTQMLQLENPQDCAMVYKLSVDDFEGARRNACGANWRGVLVPQQVRLATDPLNPLSKYY